MMGGKRRDRERFPDLKENIGEDPAQYLDVDRVDDLQLARARIRGIDYLATLRAWKAVERNLVENGVVSEHHRQQVMGWLDEREADLEELGERDERLADIDIQARREATQSTPSQVRWPDREDGDRETNSVDANRYQAAATDGGEDA